MTISKKMWTLILVVISMAVLVVDDELLGYSSIDLHLSILTFNEMKTDQPYVFIIIIFALLLLSLFFHTKALICQSYEAFEKGYKQTRSLVMFVAAEVAESCGHQAAGAPFGDFKPSIKNRSINCGRFTLRNSGLSENIIVNIPISIHCKCFITGLCRSLRVIFLTGLVPVVIGLWAILCITT